jgi:hypothetical protein
VHLVEHFSRGKVMMQRFGSRVVNRAAGTTMPDAASGFRAYSRDSLMLLNTITRFSYTMETIIQAGNKRLRIDSVPVTTNPKTRESRLFRSSTQHVRMSAAAILRAWIMYRPITLFAMLAVGSGVLGLVPYVRWAYLQATDTVPGGHVQSLVAGAVLLIFAFLCLLVGIIADLVRTNRILIEDTLEHTKKMRFGRGLELPQRAVQQLQTGAELSDPESVAAVTSGPDTAASVSGRAAGLR